MLLALCVTCVLSGATAGARRSLSATGDILGTYVRAPLPAATFDDVFISRSREVADHAHFYNAAEVITQWAESTFALTAYAHSQLMSLPDGGRSSACVYDGKHCLLNPLVVAGSNFPSPELPAER